MTDLVAWLRQQLDDDERAAQAAANYSAERGYSFPTDVSGTYNMLADEHERHATRHNPARVLAEVDAKRRILDLAAPVDGPHDDEQVHSQLAIAHVLRLLALPYADRPSYRDEWKP